MERKNILRRFLAVLLSLTLVCSLGIQAFAAPAQEDAEAAGSENASVTLEQARASLREKRAQAGLVEGSMDALDPDAVIRVMVETSAAPAVLTAGTIEWNAQTQQAETQALRKQESVISSVQKITGNAVINQSAYLVSTFTTDMTVAQMQQVAALPDVVSVTPVTTFELKMNYATAMTTVTKMWNELGYTGENTVIAVIDSGVNWKHPDMVLSEGAEVKITEADAQAMIDTLGYGTYYSEKVPFGHSYCEYYEMDNVSSPHGLHVSGIAAGNGGEDGITGVAPDAQILGLQVFGMSGSAYTDDILRAVEDAVKLGADVMNLSLGSTAGFYDDVDFLQFALEQASQAGVLCCVAAGNDGSSASLLGINTNDFGLVDTGAVSSPSTAPSALAVASVNNDYVKGATITVTAGDEEYETVIYNFSSRYEMLHASRPSRYSWSLLQDMTLIDCGYGSQDELMEMKDLLYSTEHWVAVIQRGDLSFQDKVINAYGFGAEAVIIYNNIAGDAVPFNVSTEQAGTSSWMLYQIMVSNNFGLQLLELAEAGTKVSFGDLVDKFVAAADGGEMSTFSSWGTTPTLDIKPEISAPGGNIYSISSGEDYQVMSGTSMATPYVSGASALVIGAVNDAIAAGELSLGKLNMAQYVKLALMNTADPLYAADGTAYSVRQQGAGMVDPAGAAQTRVLATVDGLGSAALGEIGASASFVITLTNYGTEAATYTLAPDPLYTDVIVGEDKIATVAPISGTITYSQSTVTVPAGGTAQISASVSSAGAEQNHFVEGFVTLTGDGCESLGLPVMGFYGDWFAAENIIDAPMYTDESIFAKYDLFSTSLASDGMFAGMNDAGETIPDYYCFSPNGDNYFDSIFPVLSLLRSADTLTIEILDSDEQPIRTIVSTKQVNKLLAVDYSGENGIYGTIADYTGLPVAWDGTIYDQATGSYVACPEGQYYMRVTATMDAYDGTQVITMPVKIDNTEPVAYFESAVANGEKVTVSFRASDNVAVYDQVAIYVNGKETDLCLDECSYDAATGIYSVDVEGSMKEGELNEFGIYIMDYAQNDAIDYYYTNVEESALITYSTLTNVEDSWYESFTLADYSNLSWIIKLNPKFLDGLIFTQDIRGSANSAITSLTVDGEDVALSTRGSFAVTKELSEGKNEFHVVAKDAQGNVLVDEVKLVYLTFGLGVDARFYPTCYPDNMELCPATFFPASRWTMWDSLQNNFGFYTLYDTEIPMVSEVEGDISSITITYFDPDYVLTRDVIQLIVDKDINIEGAEYETITLTQEDFVDGKASFTLPLAKIDGYLFDDPADAEIFTDLRRNDAFITITDMVGSTNNYLVRAYNKQYTELQQKEDGKIDDYNILEDPDSIVSYVGFEYIKPFDDMEIPYVFTPEDVDENGCIHVEGKILDEDYEDIYANGEKVNEGSSQEFSFDYKLQPGVNHMHIFTDSSFDTMGYSVTFAYLPEPTSITFDDARIFDGAVIQTTASSLDVSGTISAYFLGKNLTINGDSVILEGNMLTAPNGGKYIVDFSYTVELADGENVITVVLEDAFQQITTVTFKVIKVDAMPDPTPVVPGNPFTPSEAGKPAAPAFPFTDVTKNDWFYDAVRYAYENGLMNGTGGSLFSPNANTTRGMIVTILARLEGVDTSKGGTWYEAGRKWAMENGISDGTSMEGQITREQLATMLYRYAQLKGYDTTARADLSTFADASSVSDWAKEAMQWAVAKGLIQGSDNLLTPTAPATRAQVATILMRFIG